MVTGKPELAADQLKIWIRFSVLYQTTMKHKPNAGMWQGPFWPQRVRSSSTGLACWALADQLWKVRSRSSGRVVSRAERDPMFNRRRRFRTVSEDGVSVAIRAVLPAGSPGGIVRFLLPYFVKVLIMTPVRLRGLSPASRLKARFLPYLPNLTRRS